MSTHPIADALQREQALNPAESFIIQAPAGSGKTGLLVQRFLQLLAVVDDPEEIIAITFTRKAAGEMRERIVEALHSAHRPEPEQDYEKTTWQLACKVMQRDQQQGWQLESNPGRLRIQTIDSLCTILARQMPLLSRFGAVPGLTEDASDLYEEAANRTIAELESTNDWSDSIEHLVLHLDNRLDQLQRLIISMLARRDQWLRHVADPDHPSIERSSLESAFKNLVETFLQGLDKKFPAAHVDEFLKVVRFAGSNAAKTKKPELLEPLADLGALPGTDFDSLQTWQLIRQFLLKVDGDWRIKLNVSNGFPAQGAASTAEQKALFKDMKARAEALLAELDGEEIFREQLAAIQSLPDPHYTDEEWDTLQALFEILRLAAAQLEVVFREQGQVDFSAMAQAAILALGDELTPTDLALSLDYQVKHLLIDEFQDTSWNQYELLQRLIAGWTPGDGRTLFLVGDPMQSIYRFREAEVGLFLKSWEHGVNHFPLNTLNLKVNFRSQAGIIEWVNQAFGKVFPAEDNIELGAVKYATSVAHKDPLQGDASLVYPFIGRDDAREAEQVLEIIQQAKAEQADGTIAILVRSRSHLVEIVSALKVAGERFRAVEIEALGHRPVVRDLLALTRALINPADRIAWLSILRAPWCGLRLEDLYRLSSDPSLHLIEAMQDDKKVKGLSTEARTILERVTPVLEHALTERDRTSLRNWVESTWLMLGGPACVTDATDLEDAEVYLRLLEGIEDHSETVEPEDLAEKVARLFALPDVMADEHLQIMTLHKSKGLEFDTVILPGLGRRPGATDTRLLAWLERPREDGGNDLLLAPIRQSGADENPKYRLLSDVDKNKIQLENARLLYVATTRAKQRLHLLGHVETKQDKEGNWEYKPPQKDTLLSSLWSVVQPDYQQAFQVFLQDEPEGKTTDDEVVPVALPIRRLPVGWCMPQLSEGVRVSMAEPEESEEELIEFSWASTTARFVGNAVHQLLQHIGQQGVENLQPDWMNNVDVRATHLLVQMGTPVPELDRAVKKAIKALKNCLADKRGRWVLDNRHQDVHCEYPVTGKVDGQLKHLVIDRTFVDEHGTRWIIDYKTGSHLGSGLDEFLDREQERYQAQLEGYAQLFREKGDHKIRLGLYFPMMNGWREWEFE